MNDANSGLPNRRGRVALRPGELPRAAAQSRRVDGGGAAWIAVVARSPELIPGVAAVAVFLFWATAQGGVMATDSYPGALFLLGVLSATLYAFRARLPRLPRLPLAAIALLGAFALWNFLSIVWADDQGAAWDGANRCLLYLTAFVIFTLPPWRSRTAAALLGLYAVGIGLIGGTVLLKAAGSANPLEYFVAGRFAEPTGYHNANAALFTGAMLIAIFLASRRESPWPARGLMLALAGVLFQLALLPQGRGWLIAAPLAALAYFAFVPGLVRSLIMIGPLAVVAALTANPVLDVFEAVVNPAELEPALDSARDATLIGAVALFLAGSLIGFLDHRLDLSEQAARVGSRAVLGLAGAIALGGAVVAIGVIGNPIGWTGDRWDDFKSGEFEHEFESSRLSQGLGSNRYDFWSVAFDEFKDSPIRGVGSENFAEDYMRERNSDEEPTHPHNLSLRILAQTGLVGAALFFGFLIAALIGVGRTRLRSSDPLGRGVGGLAAVVFVYWFAHSTGDWFWAFPALSAPVFAWLGLGMRVGADRRLRPPPSWASDWGRPAAVGAGVAVVFAALSLALPWTAAVDTKKAAETWGAGPNAAYDRLDRAADLNFLSANPYLVEGAIASRLDQPRRMRIAFDRALDRDPDNWYATLELAALDAIEGDSQSALERLQRVSELNPREPVTDQVRQGVLSGPPVSLETLDAIFLERYCRRLGRDPGPDGCEAH
ncbi:MAG: O-antigen ligase family protein [Solirubrobacterales bacterium]